MPGLRACGIICKRMSWELEKAAKRRTRDVFEKTAEIMAADNNISNFPLLACEWASAASRPGYMLA